jgi:hypothetical protein
LAASQQRASYEYCDWLIEYLMDKVDETDDEIQGDASLVLSAMHAFGSSTQRASYIIGRCTSLFFFALQTEMLGFWIIFTSLEPSYVQVVGVHNYDSVMEARDMSALL